MNDLPSTREFLRASWQLRFTVLFVLFSLILTTAIGHNWGPPFRSFYSGWPFLFCLLFLPLAYVRSRALPCAVAFICLLRLVHMWDQARELEAKNPPAYMQGVTVANVAAMNGVLADIQLATHRHDLLFAGPDMGGIMLYSDGIRVIDLAMLCDPVLSHQRFAGMNSYVLQQRKPDVIEIHSPWSRLYDLDRSPLFLDSYRPVYVRGVRVFIRRSLLADIDRTRLVEKNFNSAGQPEGADISTPSYIRLMPGDYALDRDFDRYLVLRQGSL